MVNLAPKRFIPLQEITYFLRVNLNGRVLWKFQGSFKSLSGKFQVYIKGVLSVFQVGIKGIWKKFKDNF